jgi:molybdopterin-guanine dinucleotide biosynthesis protein A
LNQKPEPSPHDLGRFDTRAGPSETTRTEADPPTAERTTAVILCGGAGRRVGGADKPLLTLGGRPVLEWVLDRITPQVADVVISANRNLTRYRAYGPVVTDDAPGHNGPLAGVLAAARVIKSPWMLVCPGDAPRLPADLLQRLAAAAAAHLGASGLGSAEQPAHASAAVAETADGRQPLPLLVRTERALELAVWLSGGERRVGRWIEHLNGATADYRGRETLFANLNHPDMFDPNQAPI